MPHDTLRSIQPLLESEQQRTCKNCRLSFLLKPTGSKAVFCSARCRNAHHRRTRKEMARNEWYSPAEAVEAARTAMGGIDLDPASCPEANKIVRAERFYTIRDDGLTQPWFGRIWLNPPYGRHAPKFVQRFAGLFTDGSVQQGCLLLGTHHLTTKWFSALASLDPIGCLPEKRLQFSGTTTRPAHGSVIVGIGVDAKRFEIAFTELGRLCYF